MRAINVASLALIGTAALALGAPAALADDGSSITSFGSTLPPTAAAQGDTGTLNATECEAGYDITSDCLGGTGTAPLTAADGSDLHTGSTQFTEPTDTAEANDATETTGKAEPARPMEPVEPAKPAKSFRPVKPGGGVKGGTGGSFADLSPTQIGVGSALIAGALAGGGVLMLRRPTGNGS
ncbi:hypothetical protein [Streptomyces sp. NBC_01481]|uniref:hypothetical protein n=1 Tax=Streptomyces sp. NBC_01481 TaxID=2975869 RepID=UPI00224DC19E|nr:hypothetical protein [Streptomyces sp. NBC_01481]MCX4585632.1 hypothetical protein [Streptomyces sp. NBC_01481]